MLYRTMPPENSTAFGTPEAPQAPQASEAMQAPPGLVLHLMDNDQDRDFEFPTARLPMFRIMVLRLRLSR